MKKTIYLLVMLGIGSLAFGQMSIGVDVVNRYVWRGTDYGNSASVQPSIEYANGVVTVGAWGAWSTSGATGGNENDLYLSTSIGPVGLTVTDYFFPAYSGSDDIFNQDNHIIELSAGMDLGAVTSMVAYNLSGDDDNSAYVELGYGPVTLGMGNGFYTVGDDPDFGVVSLGISATRDIYTISYILNPEQETSFLIFGFSL
ncbi:MAG: hypothetical protein ISR87_00595 [Candidatus Marinimicrobia bacterium]|nr:hypothetical protein [FCB group bacterium]MBL7023923.1 hypothetical protein [Candidatus Neomarinimicrobiota bacterium]